MKHTFAHPKKSEHRLDLTSSEPGTSAHLLPLEEIGEPIADAEAESLDRDSRERKPSDLAER